MLKKNMPLLFIAAGLLLLTLALGQTLLTRYNQMKLVREFTERIENESKNGTGEGEGADKAPPSFIPLPDRLDLPGITDGNNDAVKEPGEDSHNNEASAAPEEGASSANGDESDAATSDVTIIGILTIPKINVKVAVAEGTGAKELKYTVGHFPQTAAPGGTGNFAVIGHRSYRFGQFFNRLDEVEPGDRVTVKNAHGTFTYKITEVFVVEPEDTWVLNTAESGVITLITCTPVRVATHRLIVRGVLEN